MSSFEDLVAGLEAEWDQEQAQELAAEVADRTRGELARLTLVQRLQPLVGHDLTVAAQGQVLLHARLCGVGPDWVLLREHPAREHVVALAAVNWIEGLGRASAPAGTEGQVAARTRLGMVLRRLVRDRAHVALTLRDGVRLTGVLDRVGVDLADVAVVPVGEARRSAAVQAVRTVPLAAISAVTRE